MCGIVGAVCERKQLSKEVLDSMTDTLEHRGPDDRGTMLKELDLERSIGLGHRRLSILDLTEAGHQPMVHDNLTIVFNGEIYNFREIRDQLSAHGYSFFTESDTEVVLKAFHSWGMAALEQFVGMFAIALYDEKDEKLYLIRDRAGVKPLYWYQDEKSLLFASELKALHPHPSFRKEIDYNGLASFFRYGYIPAPYTIFRNARKLKAGHYLQYDLKTGEISEIKYWDVYDAYNKPKMDIGEEEALNELEKILEDAFAYRMVADVPVGVFLSGGYDSSCVAALLQKNSTQRIKTFTIGFHKRDFNEAPLAKEYAHILGTEHHEHYCTEADAMAIIPQLAEIYDEPFGDSSAIPTTLVSQIAKEHVDVALSADGSDEIFAGYNKHVSESNRFERYSKFPSILRRVASRVLPTMGSTPFEWLNHKTLQIPNYRNKVGKFVDMMRETTLENIFHRSNYYFTDVEIRRLIRHSFQIDNAFTSMDDLDENNDAMSKILAVDYKTYLSDDILTKVDRATMSVSLEGREPFLDHRIIEFAARLPIELKYKDGTSKYLIRKLVHRYIPQELIDRPKKGFSIPLNEWYEGELSKLFAEYLDPMAIRKTGVLEPDEVETLLRRYAAGEKFLIRQIWFIFVFQLWAERWL